MQRWGTWTCRAGLRVSDLYRRVLLWHTLVARVTGGLALCSAKRTLPREEATAWADSLQNVADEIREVLARRPFILDDKGRRMVGCDVKAEPPTPQFFNQGAPDEVVPIPAKGELTASQSKTVGPKAGGLRVARRKTNG